MITCKSWLLFIASYIYILYMFIFTLGPSLKHRCFGSSSGKPCWESCVSVCVCCAAQSCRKFVCDRSVRILFLGKQIYIYIYIIIYSASGPRLSVSIDSNRSKLLDSGVGAGSGLFSCHRCGWFGMGENLLSHSVRGVLVHI